MYGEPNLHRGWGGGPIFLNELNKMSRSARKGHGY